MGFFDDYDANFQDKRSQLGTGAFSTVYRCVNKATGEVNAVKVIPLKTLKSSEVNKIQREIRICTELSHENIVRMRKSYHDQSHFYLVFEFVSGGELFDEIVTRKYYNEKDASQVMRQILEALEHCHSQNIIHRDLKPENLLLASKEKDAPVKITDFGLAVIMEHGPSYFGFAGTPGYLSPEVIRRVPYDTAVDIWACGVILYILLVGYPPFWEEDQKKLYAQIKACEFDFPSPEWDSVTDAAKDLITKMLNPDPKKRLTIQQVLAHPWLSSGDVPAALHRQGTIDQLKKFNAKRKLKGGINAVIGLKRIASLLGGGSSGKASPVESASSATSTAPSSASSGFGSLVKKAVAAGSDSSSGSTEGVIEGLSERLLAAIAAGNFEEYSDFMDPSVTCFEPESKGILITGLDFHKFFFDNGSSKVTKTFVHSSNVTVHGTTAIHTCTRVVQTANKTTGDVSTDRWEETRVWVADSAAKHKWKVVHFHRS